MTNISHTGSPAQPGVLPADIQSNWPLKRISWPAVFAGVAMALVVQLLLSLLGTGVGLSTIDPLNYNGTPSATAFSVGAGLWWVVSSFLSLAIGGWITAHLSGFSVRVHGIVHGLVTWALVTLVTAYLIGSVISSVVSGSASAIGAAASATGQGVAAAVPQIAEVANRQLAQSGISPLEQIRREAQAVLNPNARNSGTLANVVTDPEFNSLLERFLTQGRAATQQADRDALINIVATRTGVSREEAARRVQYWEVNYAQAVQKFEEVKQEAAQTSREVADATANAVSKTALWSFLALLLGAVAAALGGIAGSISSSIVARNTANNTVNSTVNRS